MNDSTDSPLVEWLTRIAAVLGLVALFVSSAGLMMAVFTPPQDHMRQSSTNEAEIAAENTPQFALSSNPP